MYQRIKTNKDKHTFFDLVIFRNTFIMETSRTPFTADQITAKCTLKTK